MKNIVLVTGATGNTGGSAVKNLLKLNIPVRAMVRQLDERSDALSEMGVEVVKGDLLNLDDVSKALYGVNSAFFVYTIREAGILEATSYFAQAAIETGVTSIVNLSQFGAHRHARSHGAQNHWLAERLFERSGLSVTHLRPTLFAEWFMYQAMMIKTQDKFFLPFGDARFAPIATEDIGRVIAAVLADPLPHAGKSYDLFGPEILNMTEIAAIFSEALDRVITYVPVETEMFVDILKKFLNPDPYFIQHVSSLGQDLKEGREAGMNDLVEVLTGQKPMSMFDFALNHKGAFA